MVLENGILYRKFKDVLGGGLHPKLQLVLPTTLVPEVLTSLHNSPIGGHMGARKTLEKVQYRFYWPGQRKGAIAASYAILENPRPKSVLHFNLQRMCVHLCKGLLGLLPQAERGNCYKLSVIILQDGKKPSQSRIWKQ